MGDNIADAIVFVSGEPVSSEPVSSTSEPVLSTSEPVSSKPISSTSNAPEVSSKIENPQQFQLNPQQFQLNPQRFQLNPQRFQMQILETQDPYYKKKNNTGLALLLFLIVIIILIMAFMFIQQNSTNSQNSFMNLNSILMPPSEMPSDPLQVINDPYPTGRFYYAQEVDPIVTGNLYNETNNLRPVYSQRTAFGLPSWQTQAISTNGNLGYQASRGLTEFSSSGSSGDVGVTVGPLVYNDLTSIDVGPVVFPSVWDDGIPQEWNFPSTPMLSWYESHIPTEDYYGPEGPTVYALKGINIPFEPDHEPLMN